MKTLIMLLCVTLSSCSYKVYNDVIDQCNNICKADDGLLLIEPQTDYYATCVCRNDSTYSNVEHRVKVKNVLKN